jgi:hypothetical protein
MLVSPPPQTTNYSGRKTDHQTQQTTNERFDIMKTLLNKVAGRRAFRLGVPLTTTLLLAALPVAAADTPYTATGWVIGVPVPGIWCTNALGQVGTRGNAHLARVVSTDARLTGRRTIFVDGAAQADGSSIIYGPAYQEVGTWDVTETNFTATGGMWETTYRGIMGTDGSLQLHLVGSGWGGTIDGLRLDETVTRTNGPILDPAIPYQYTGTIKPPPLNTNQVLDNFDDNLLTDWGVYGSGSYFNTNAQLTARGYYPGVLTTSILDSYVLGGHSPNWTVPDGQTREWRVDLVSLNENATNTAILGVGTTSGLYAVHKGRDFVYLVKWPTSGGGFSIFACEKAAIRNTNVVLAIALTRVQPNLVVTARVLDKADPNTVLYQCTVVDTPNADPTLNAAQFQALTGMSLLDLGPDAAGASFTSFGTSLGVFQYTDGTQPAVLATFDNLELRTSEVPGVSIVRAMGVLVPDSATVEGAPTLQGPWFPLLDTTPTGMHQMTVPTSELMQFFRARQAP